MSAGLAGAVGLGVLAGWLGWRVWGGHPPGAPARVLARRELAALAAMADAIFPPGGPLGVGGSEAGIPGYADRLLAASHARQRRLARLLFFLIEHFTLCFPGPGVLAGRRRFSAQPLDARIAVLEAWRTSGWFGRRLAFTSLRAIATLGYLAHPEVLRRLDLAPHEIESPVCEADLLYPRIGAARASIPLGESDLTAPSGGTPLAPGSAT